MTVPGQVVKTQQVMLATATLAPLTMIHNRTFAVAPDFLAAVHAELADARVRADMAQAAFSVQ